MPNPAHVCAFCEVGTDLTKEHIFPECLHKRVPSGETTSIAKTPQGDKAVSDPPRVRDVCARCNNGPLSELDTYICDLHDQYFKTTVHRGDRVDFKFDFDQLLRWLLKTSYNTARVRGWDFKKDSRLLRYILGEGLRPPGFHVFLLLMIPTQTSSLAWQVRPEADEILPQASSSNSLDVKSYVGIAQGYQVSLNSYFFHIFRESENLLARVRESGLRAILKHLPGACELSDKNRAVVFSSSLEYMTYHAQNPVLQHQTELAKQHVQRLKQKKITK
jgi:hypothetical protein